MRTCDICGQVCDNKVKVKINHTANYIKQIAVLHFCSKCIKYVSFGAFLHGVRSIIEKNKE